MHPGEVPTVSPGRDELIAFTKSNHLSPMPECSISVYKDFWLTRDDILVRKLVADKDQVLKTS